VKWGPRRRQFARGPRDYEEFLESLNAHGVRYLVVEAHAVAFHARPRATEDLELLIDPTAENAGKTLAAIRDLFGGSDLGLTTADLIKADAVVQLGVAPSCIDLRSGEPRRGPRALARLGSSGARSLR
jgi:hypothetical protein